MKKIINKPEDVVTEMCKGMALAHRELVFADDYKGIKRREATPDKVTLISGGGSGHEPAHGGFVGKGMLDVAVCGDVFASPSQIQVYKAIKETKSDKGTLLIIKNYSGDMMNFKNAAQLAGEEGITVDYVKVDDDIAVQDSLYTVGRRGVAGTVLVHKIAGAAAEAGLSLAEVKAVANKAISHVKSIGFAYTSCTVPAKGTPTFELGEDEMEYGVGIHGEPGIQREKVLTADELAKRMVDALVKELELTGEVKKVALLVNGFGGTPAQELYLLNYSVAKELEARNITIGKTLVGNYMTSIDMAGASISLLNLDDELEKYLNAPCDTAGLKVTGHEMTEKAAIIEKESISREAVSYQVQTKASYAKVSEDKVTLENVIYMVDKMSESIIENEVPFCEVDAHAGDGDFGMSVAKGFRELKKDWNHVIENQSIGGFLMDSSMVIMEYCGGASGPIWGSAFRAAGLFAGDRKELTLSEFAEMMQAAVKGIQETGKRSFGRGAVVGDKTLIDALVPCADTLSRMASAKDVKAALMEGAKAAVEGAKATEKIVARMGRAGAVGERSLGYPDAGAYGLGVIFTDVARSMEN
ncbi:MAG TPA: dihydroxyacetone kinase subunit DhaK [Candidatus Pelethocola excrementipullorum]|nr:dihydroxyacetone kinase subunit DhaK [Candidatus Pelethocola excrementipullorum]